ncbi:O-antigen ligase [Allofrancisella inopinata]|uniref:O-antigen ligase domain-containing protein n=1 Tax=Allofrancisella inopinata TaxID=1085647 RepID=A0AAE6YHN9_9GAMM|nr:O-antigen ligase family protein [Allofrancisella inopinata]QIV95990.1 O-antigen ligase domain-containing protein [Allofrancisella inopinata]TDT74412.1 O-antigen ligase [Allofrancisella inopinata]
MNVKAYSRCTNYLLAFGLIFLLTPLRTIEILAVSLILLNIFFYIKNIKECNKLFKENRRFIFLLLLLPIYSLVMALIHLDGRLMAIPLVFFIPFILIMSLNYITLQKSLFLICILIGAIITLIEVLIAVHSGAVRFDPTYYNTIYSGLFSSTEAACCFYFMILFLENKEYLLSTLMFFVFVVMSVACLYMASKGAIICLLIAIFCIPFFLLNWKKIILFVTCSVFIVGVLFTGFKNSSYVERFSEMFHSIEISENNQVLSTSTGIRLQLYRASLICAKQHPFIGCNIEQAHTIKEDLMEKNQASLLAVEFQHFHSDFFNSLGKMGVVGAIFWCIFWVSTFAFFLLQRGENTEIKLSFNISILLIVTFFINSLFDSMMAYGKGVMFLALVVIFAAAFNKQGNFSNSLER